MKVVLRLDKISSTWSVDVLEPTHNHPSSAAITAHPAHRIAAISLDTHALICSLSRAGLSPGQILTALRELDPTVPLIPKDIANLTQRDRLKQLDGLTPIIWLLKVYNPLTLLPNLTFVQELQDTGFNPQHYPETGPLQRLFFIHPTSIILWKQHPDVLLLDCTYKTNRYGMPLLNICAISDNNMVIQVGLAFISGEKEVDYTWVLAKLRDIMDQNTIEEPLSIVTDRELALITCLYSQFPTSRHLLCRWHVNMNVLAKTKGWFPSPVKINGQIQRHPQFQEFLSNWNKTF